MRCLRNCRLGQGLAAAAGQYVCGWNRGRSAAKHRWNAGSTRTVKLRARDNNNAANPLFVSQVAEATISVTAGEDQPAWQNAVHRCDVNDDRLIRPLDVLVEINAINDGERF